MSFILLVSICLLPSLICRAQDHDNDTQGEESGPTKVFPHSKTARWWVSGQINIVFQAHPAFHALYSGPNSLSSRGEHATSRVLTLYTGYQLSNSTEALFDLESVGGRGISDALGMAGFTNVDVVRNPALGSEPYVARAVLHKVFALSGKEEDAERTPISTLTKLPERRLEVRVGKMSVADYFDVNSVGSDSHLQFLNWTAVNSGAYDYAADTRGYTMAAMAEYHDHNWGVRFAEALMPKVANGPKLDFNLARARSENIEVEFRPELQKEKKTVIRLLSFINHANMGSYREAVEAFLAGTDPQPTIEAHRKQGRIKYGFGLNTEQEITKNLRAFGRLGWNEGQNESFAYTEVDQGVEAGADWQLERWQRPTDKIGFAFITNGISRLHQLYLALGGNGFLLGDGRLTYGREDIIEAYYTAHLWRGVYVSPDLQWAAHPGYNKDRGPVVVPGLRLHLEL
ncbi:MAG TPA: carbohydrate porin [Candidatus Dormibacteraeota bacterium]|nr:carbohydrate porin [Candidatus Dormibacteraeota bacterium]